MNRLHLHFILGSRSPRRLELLQLLVPASRIVVRPPADSSEPGFDGLHDTTAIHAQLRDIARLKSDDVVGGLEADRDLDSETVVVTADTVVIATDCEGQPRVLGQPPEDPSWRETVESWFLENLAGKAHQVSTALCVVRPDGQRIETVTTTEVVFRADVDRYLDWYLSTGEPRGKAGGYAIQGAGSVLVSSVTGSLSNVIGLPLESLMSILAEAEIDLTGVDDDG